MQRTKTSGAMHDLHIQSEALLHEMQYGFEKHHALAELLPN